jgi:hypothetical protein
MIETAALLRLIPYLIGAYLSFRKGYPVLGVTILYIVCIALFNYILKPPTEIRAILGGITAIGLLAHIARLNPRR